MGSRSLLSRVTRDLWGGIPPSGADGCGLDPIEVIPWGTQGDVLDDEQVGKGVGAT